MERFRKGNDRITDWTVTRLNSPEEFRAKDLRLFRVDHWGTRTEVTDYSITENTLRIPFWGKDQKATGKYYYTLEENSGKQGMLTVDSVYAFELVDNTSMEGGKPEAGVTNYVVKISSNIETPSNGLSAYELAILNGFEGSVIDWLESLHLHLEDLTPDEIAVLQKPATEAASLANTAAEGANTAAGRANELANHPNIKKDGNWWTWDVNKKQYVDSGQSAEATYELTKQKVEAVLTEDITTHNHASQLAAALAGYVKIVIGKDLSTNDFTNEFKQKLEGLSNYDDKALQEAIAKVNGRIDTLVGTSASEAIDTFNEIEAFLKGITDKQSLTGLLNDLKVEITALIPKKTSELTNDSNFVSDKQYVHTDNNFTTAEKEKLSTIEGTMESKINPIVESDKVQNEKITLMETQIAGLQQYHGSDYCVGAWEDRQLAPESLETKGSKEFALAWYPWLVDMTDNAGPTVTKARTLKKNNWFRYANGDFAPAVCVTAEDWAQCDAELYLDAGHTQKYCDAGAFNAEAFYNEHGVSIPLYGVDGVQILHVRRPWETTNKDLSNVIGRKDSVRLCDNLQGRSGKIWKGVFGSQTNFDGAQFGQFVLPPTGISPTPICTVGNKTRSFFYLMEGETNCKSHDGAGGVTNLFSSQKRTYPRVADVHQVNNAKWARSNNADPSSTIPFAEGGYMALNTFITCMEIAYGTKYLSDPELFSSGISSNEYSATESAWRKYGGVRYKRKGVAEWQYNYWAASAEIYYDANGKKSNLSDTINYYYPKTQVNEGQIAASYAAELGIPEGQQYEMYGSVYWWESVPGAKSLTEGEMNVRVFKLMSGKINGFLQNGTPQEWDFEIVLRFGLIQGMDLSGDVFAYWGGGYEQVATVDAKEQEAGGYGSKVDLFIEPDQTKWLSVSNSTINKEETFPFEDQYIYLGRVINKTSSYTLQRNSYSCCPAVFGGGRNTGECYYAYFSNWWGATTGQKVRVGVRFRGSANNDRCAPRCFDGYSSAMSTYRYFAASAQVLLGAAECNALQAPF